MAVAVRSHAPPQHRPSVSLPQPPPPQPVPLPIHSPVHHPHPHHHHVPPVSLNAPLPHVLERTQHDIFREIVSECAQLERSNTTTPFSDLGSAPTSPLTPMAPAPSPVALASPMGPSQGFLYDQLPPPNYAPPPYPTESHIYPHPPGYGIPPIMVTTSPNPQMPNALLLEEVVKMVVSAMSQSSLGDPTKENPEDILRRKRNQNNEAAARYRKRQRAARQRAEEELALLSKRNDDLRTTVNHMEGEIQQLKEMVLTKKEG